MGKNREFLEKFSKQYLKYDDIAMKPDTLAVIYAEPTEFFPKERLAKMMDECPTPEGWTRIENGFMYNADDMYRVVENATHLDDRPIGAGVVINQDRFNDSQADIKAGRENFMRFVSDYLAIGNIHCIVPVKDQRKLIPRDWFSPSVDNLADRSYITASDFSITGDVAKEMVKHIYDGHPDSDTVYNSESDFIYDKQGDFVIDRDDERYRDMVASSASQYMKNTPAFRNMSLADLKELNSKFREVLQKTRELNRMMEEKGLVSMDEDLASENDIDHFDA